MYDYTGLNFNDILELAEALARKSGFEPSREELATLINEAMVKVAIDIEDPMEYQRASWPSSDILNYPDNCMLIRNLFADEVQFVYLPFPKFKQKYGDDF